MYGKEIGISLKRFFNLRNISEKWILKFSKSSNSRISRSDVMMKDSLANPHQAPSGQRVYWSFTNLQTQDLELKLISGNEKTGNSPICSMMSEGKTREAKALRKMSENSLSRPPIPILSKFQSGLIMDWRFSLVLDFPSGWNTNRLTGRKQDQQGESLPFTGTSPNCHFWVM